MFFRKCPVEWPEHHVSAEDKFAHAIGALMIEWGYIDQWTSMQQTSAFISHMIRENQKDASVWPTMDDPKFHFKARLEQLRPLIVAKAGANLELTQRFERALVRIDHLQKTRNVIAHGRNRVRRRDDGDVLEVEDAAIRMRSHARSTRGEREQPFDDGITVFTLEQLMDLQVQFRELHIDLLKITGLTQSGPNS